MGVPERFDQQSKIFTGDGDRLAAQAVVGTEFQNYNSRAEAQYGGKPLDAIGSRITADSEIHDVIAVARSVDLALEKIRKALARFEAEACGEAVAKSGNNGPIVRNNCGLPLSRRESRSQR